jgi:hypothetical protein
VGRAKVEGVSLDLRAADAYCRVLTRGHYENFSVASRFVDAARRRDLMRIYAFCRTTDDLGDESPEGTALARLERWRDEVRALFGGVAPVHPVLVALAQTVERRAIAAQPFLDLIEANVQDQHVVRYGTWDDLDAYCRLSAAPVGRMVLRVFGVMNENANIWSKAMSRRWVWRAAPSAWSTERGPCLLPASGSRRWCRGHCGCSWPFIGWEGWPSATRSKHWTTGPRRNGRAFRPQRRYPWCFVPQ